MSLQDELKALNEIVAGYDVLKQRISELEEQVEEQQVEQEKVFPQYGDVYWYIETKGKVLKESWDGFGFEIDVLEMGNIFHTEEEAEFAAEKLKVEAELRKFSRPFEYGRFNYYLFFDIDGDNLKVDFSSYCQPQGAIYFQSGQKAEQAIASVGAERIKKYIFEVEVE